MLGLASLEQSEQTAYVFRADFYKPVPEFARMVTRLARVPMTLRINSAPDVCRALDRRTGETLVEGLIGGAGLASFTRIPAPT